jgi:hypothetical protein
VETRTKQESDDEEEEEDFNQRKKGRPGRGRPLWSLKVDKEGGAVLPTFEQQPKLPVLKDIIRSFVTHGYSKCHAFSALFQVKFIVREIH